jgi:hypothetical protein
MQTFLPYASFQKTFECLDYKRLGKQRIEAYQILCCLLDRPTKSGKLYKGWKQHPAVKMWTNYEEALKKYYNLCIDEWVARGYKNKMEKEPLNKPIILPDWWGYEPLHSSHRANLLRKDPVFYGKLGWSESPREGYFWPTQEGIIKSG